MKRLLLTALLATVSSSLAQEPVVHCEKGWCIVRADVLQRWMNEAQAAERYMQMCGWSKP